jgi:hypothetical protein
MSAHTFVGTVIDAAQSYPIYRGTPEYEALIRWLQFHELDPDKIPSETTIERDAKRGRILYTTFAVDDKGRIEWNAAGDDVVHVPAVQQGEGVLPLPRVITAGNTHDVSEPS